MLRRHFAFAAAVALLAACSKGGENAATDTTTAAGAIADTGVGSSAAAAHNGWTDGQIVAFSVAADNGEIGEAKVAEQKATNPAVKAYARQIARDHEAMLTDAKSYAEKKTVMPDTTKDAVADLMKNAHDDIQDLQSKPAGKDFDADYIDKQIDGHQKVLQQLQDAEKATTDPQLKDMLTKAIGKVQEHLTKAQDIKQNQLKS